MAEQVKTKTGTLVKETDKAWLADLDTHDEPVWLPKSQVEYDEDDHTFTIPLWLCEEKGIE